MEVDALLAAPWAGLRCFHEWEGEGAIVTRATIVTPRGGRYDGGLRSGVTFAAAFALPWGYDRGLRSKPPLLVPFQGVTIATRQSSPALCSLG